MWMRRNEFDRMFHAVDLLQNRMDRLFSGYGGSWANPFWDMPQSGPRTNLYDFGDHLEMNIEVPGIGREDLDVKVRGNYLEISGSRKPDAPEGYSPRRVERLATGFTRSFTLPAEIDADNVKARLARMA